MRRNLKFLPLVLVALSLSCSTSKQQTTISDNLPAASLKPFGRYLINNNQDLELISSAVHVGFSFQGNECKIYASLPNDRAHNYLQYELDGEYIKRIRIEGNSKQPIIISAPTKSVHAIWLYKATEAHTGAIVIQKIMGKNLKSLEKPQAPLIEFIGNSITCGAAADASEVPCGAGQYHDQHNAYFAYGPGVARELKTNFIPSSVSGIGVYRNWNSDAPTMPDVYEKTDFQLGTQNRWNFNEHAPQVVSIALGTNDFSRGDGTKKRLPFDSSAFVSNYIRFVKQVKSKYPSAQIALLSSPMIGSDNRTLLQNCLTSVKRNIDSLYPQDKTTALHFFQQMKPRGCSGHPSVEDHAILAKELVPFFKKLIS